MRKILAAVLAAVIVTGCGTVEIDGDTMAQASAPVPTHKAELYIRETIEPEEVVTPLPDPDQETVCDDENNAEEEIVSENDNGEEAAAPEPKEDAAQAGGDNGEAEESPVSAGEDKEHDEAADQPVEEEPGGEQTGEEEEPDDTEESMHLWGVCTITFYCPCSQCCGAWAGGATASGTTPTAGRTVAADLPFGTRLMVEGREYVVEDRGVGGMWVDIFVNDHQEALNRGMYQAEVYIIDG